MEPLVAALEIGYRPNLDDIIRVVASRTDKDIADFDLTSEPEKILTIIKMLPRGEFELALFVASMDVKNVDVKDLKAKAIGLSAVNLNRLAAKAVAYLGTFPPSPLL